MNARQASGDQEARPSSLAWLMNWYFAQCDLENEDPAVGGWEHHYGVTIGTLDNPGWTLTIDLVGTSLDGREFVRQSRNFEAVTGSFVHSLDWWDCRTEKNQFLGAGGPMQLGAIIEVFREWATGLGV